jgi:hypothetical protein
MAALRSYTHVPSKPLYSRRNRKDSHVAKPEAPSSLTLAKAQHDDRNALSPIHISRIDDSNDPQAMAFPIDANTARSRCHLTTSTHIGHPFRVPPATSAPRSSPLVLSESETTTDIEETIRQLEELARELNEMDSNAASPQPRARVTSDLVRPPPRYSSLVSSARSTVVSKYSAHTPTSQRLRTPRLSPLSPLLPAVLAQEGTIAEDDTDTSVPMIVFTAPSTEQLAAQPAETRGYREPLGPGEMDEVQWVDEFVPSYGRWSDSRDDVGDDNESDRESVVSSLFMHGSDASSSTSPPSSPPILTPNVSVTIY